MSGNSSRTRLDPDLTKVGDVLKRLFNVPIARFVNEGTEKQFIEFLRMVDPDASNQSGMSDVYEILIKRLEEQNRQNQELIDWLMQQAASARIVSDETLHDQLNSLEKQLTILDDAIQFYGQPKIDRRVHDILINRLNDTIVLKCGQMFIKMYHEKSFSDHCYEISNQIISCIPDAKERDMTFYSPITNETEIILYIMDKFYRNLIEQQIDKFHDTVDQQILSPIPEKMAETGI